MTMLYMVSNGRSPILITTDKDTAYDVCRREGTEVLSWPVNVEPDVFLPPAPPPQKEEP